MERLTCLVLTLAALVSNVFFVVFKIPGLFFNFTNYSFSAIFLTKRCKVDIFFKLKNNSFLTWEKMGKRYFIINNKIYLYIGPATTSLDLTPLLAGFKTIPCSLFVLEPRNLLLHFPEKEKPNKKKKK